MQQFNAYGSSIFNNPRPDTQRLNTSVYNNQINKKRGEQIFDANLNCIGWLCDIPGCGKRFDDARKWRDHHIKSGPHRGSGVIAYQSRFRTRAQRAVITRNTKKLLVLMDKERAELRLAVKYADDLGMPFFKIILKNARSSSNSPRSRLLRHWRPLLNAPLSLLTAHCSSVLIRFRQGEKKLSNSPPVMKNNETYSTMPTSFIFLQVARQESS
jgi:hypothetical protein